MATTPETTNEEVTTTAVAATPVAAAARGKHTGSTHRILLRPVITEKALIAQVQNKYVFEVGLHASKPAIKKAFHNVFGVMPQSVNVVVRGGKTVRSGRTTGQRSDTKQAIITLKAGQAIQQ